MSDKTPNEQYQDICKDEFAEIKGLLTKLHDKLFVGNGQPPITVQIDRLNTFKKVAIWFGSVFFVAIVGLLLRIIYLHLIE